MYDLSYRSTLKVYLRIFADQIYLLSSFLQTVVTRNKLLKERKQKKEKGRHGKRLGGVVKRAMKAQGKK